MTPRDAFIDAVRAPCLGFEAAQNPRILTCVKCGRPEGMHAKKPTPVRDLDAEQEFFAEAVNVAQRVAGVYNPGYITRVMERLAIGAERYGDNAFMETDVLQEVLDETPDIAGYGVLELHKQRALGLDQNKYAELYQDLLAAASYAVVADWYANRAKRRLHEERG